MDSKPMCCLVLGILVIVIILYNLPSKNNESFIGFSEGMKHLEQLNTYNLYACQLCHL